MNNQSEKPQWSPEALAELAALVIACRAKRALYQTELASLAEVDRTTIHRVETKAAAPSSRTLVKIAIALNNAEPFSEKEAQQWHAIAGVPLDEVSAATSTMHKDVRPLLNSLAERIGYPKIIAHLQHISDMLAAAEKRRNALAESSE